MDTQFENTDNVIDKCLDEFLASQHFLKKRYLRTLHSELIKTVSKFFFKGDDKMAKKHLNE